MVWCVIATVVWWIQIVLCRTHVSSGVLLERCVRIKDVACLPTSHNPGLMQDAIPNFMEPMMDVTVIAELRSIPIALSQMLSCMDAQAPMHFARKKAHVQNATHCCVGHVGQPTTQICIMRHLMDVIATAVHQIPIVFSRIKILTDVTWAIAVETVVPVSQQLCLQAGIQPLAKAPGMDTTTDVIVDAVLSILIAFERMVRTKL